MKLNVGNLESFIRIFIGVVLLYSALHAYVGQWAGWVGAVSILSGLSRFSVIKFILGINGNTGEVQSHH